MKRKTLIVGERWDTLFRFPPCGTVAEIRTGAGESTAHIEDIEKVNAGTLGCVGCHMPAVEKRLAVRLGAGIKRKSHEASRSGHTALWREIAYC